LTPSIFLEEHQDQDIDAIIPLGRQFFWANQKRSA